MRPIAIICALLLAACTAQPPHPAVPVPRTESVPKPPVSAEPLVWQPGHWDWAGSGYLWAPGQYVPAAGHGLNWMQGWWSLTDGMWQWEPAHWVGG